MTGIKIADWLKEKIMQGEAILFLGAGASRDALNSKGEKVYVSADDIKKALSDKYLGGKKKEESLALVAEYAKDESSLRDVQEVIKELFNDVGPAKFHQKIAKFKWKAIVTTNYDLILEKAYQAEKDSLQKLVSVLGDDEHLDEILKDPDNVPYLKLHGCVTRINSNKLPLILASEQYAKYKKNRENIFNALCVFGRPAMT
jgi:hypothetical protein